VNNYNENKTEDCVLILKMWIISKTMAMIHLIRKI
jgi:hypothetical protein